MNQAKKTVKKAPIKLAALTLDVLRELCKSCLKAGTHWRPAVDAVLLDGQWFWSDSKETGRSYHGPFKTENEALVAAARENGIDRDQADALLGVVDRSSGLSTYPTQKLLEELRERGLFAGLYGAIGGLHDELERAGIIGKPGHEVLTYRAFVVRREESLLAGDVTGTRVATHWQEKIDDLGQVVSGVAKPV